MVSQQPKMIHIEVAYAEPEQQWLLQEQVPEGTTVEEALARSEIHEWVPNLKIDRVGVWYKPVKPDYVLKEGDRIEIYRPLQADPKERRRKKAAQNRSAAS